MPGAREHLKELESSTKLFKDMTEIVHSGQDNRQDKILSKILRLIKTNIECRYFLKNNCPLLYFFFNVNFFHNYFDGKYRSNV